MAAKKTQELLVCGESQNSLTHPIEILGHIQGQSLGLAGGTGAPLTSHQQTIAAGGGGGSLQSFGPLEPGTLYEFTHAPDTVPFALDDAALCYRATSSATDIAQISDYKMLCVEGSPYFCLKLRPDQSYVNFFNPPGAPARSIAFRRMI